jgi:glycosyltransferase involved in cell wall biosynthesis
MQPTAAAPLRCALLDEFLWDYTFPILDAVPNLELVTFNGATLGLPDAPNPFKLPLADSADAVLMSSYFYRWLKREHPDAIGRVFDRLERVASIVVGLDAADELALYFPPSAMERFTLVLKAMGVYRDRDLYNYEVGVLVPRGRWTEKIQPRSERYSDEMLGKLRLSIPFFLRDAPAIRHAVRRRDTREMLSVSRKISPLEVKGREAVDRLLYRALASTPISGRRQDVHCIATLTHVQRLEAVKRLSEFSGSMGITGIPQNVLGTEYMYQLPADFRAHLEQETAPYLHPPVGRIRYQFSLARHKIGVAPTGYGELTYRHGEALRAGAALVCQSLAHVELMFPLDDGRNVVFCKPDLSDLAERVRELLADDERRVRIARTGREDFVNWQDQWRAHLYRTVELPLREALGSHPDSESKISP